MDCKPFSLPAASQLLTDYYSATDTIKTFYPTHFLDDWTALLQKRTIDPANRKATVDILRTQNEAWNAPAAVMENIRLLADEKTFAVVTGQQAGVLGGPLYSFYKTMTVLKLTAKLRREYPQYNFVPVFWVEVNDSDFAEMGFIKYADKTGNLKTLRLPEDDEEVQMSFGRRPVASALAEWQAQIREDFYDNDFKEDAIARFFAGYLSGDASYANGFAQMLMSFFGEHGLILLNPGDARIIDLARPLFQQVLDRSDELGQQMTARNEAISTAGYSPQVQFLPQQTLLFFQDSAGRRLRIDQGTDGDFLLNYPGERQPITGADLQAALDRGEGALLPNVTTRPLLQDTLLPTITYVGGPGEISYFAQLAPLYESFQMSMPVVYPRHSLTIVESKLQKPMRKNQLEYAPMLARRADFVKTFIAENADQTLFNARNTSEAQIVAALNALQEAIESHDQTLLNPLKKTRQNIEGSFRKLGDRIQRSLEGKNQVQVRQIEKVLDNLLPEGNYQERVINMLYFCIKYGNGFVGEIMEALPEDVTQHYVLEM